MRRIKTTRGASQHRFMVEGRETHLKLHGFEGCVRRTEERIDPGPTQCGRLEPIRQSNANCRVGM
jgi:hypothetical protein